MKFTIRRSSELFDSNKRPVDGAKQELATQMDARSVATIEQARRCHWFEQWYQGGINHREEYGCVVCDRREKVKVWTIEINTLEELMGIYQKEGALIICASMNIKEFPNEIEIYDDYRE